MKQRKSDVLWKVVMEEVFDDFLRFIYPDADKVYDIRRGFQFLEKELAELHPDPEEETDTRFADKLVKVFHRDGEEEWVLLHIEIQGDTSKRLEFSERMFRYFYRIFDRYHRPISAVVIFTGHDGKKMPGCFRYSYRNTRLLYEYHTLCIQDFSDEELISSDNPFALVVLAAKTALLEGKIPDWELLKQKVHIANILLNKKFSQKKLRAIFVFLKNYVLFEEPEMNRIFEERIQSENADIVMGIDEYLMEVGREEGIEKSNRLFVGNLLSGTDFPDEKIASLANVSVDFVRQIKEEKENK